MKLTHIFASTLLVATAFSSAHAVTPYKADYKFKINKKYTGTAKRVLKKTSGNNWAYTIDARAAGGIARAKQAAYFSEKSGVLRSSKYNQEIKILFKRIRTSINFNHAGKKVNSVHQGKKKSYAMPRPAQDALTLEMQVREDMVNGGLRSHYYVADKNKIKKRTFTNMGKQTIKVPAGTFNVIKIKLNHQNPKRQTFFYLSPKHDYLPVKIYQDDKGKVYDFQLKKLY